ncbi:MAG: putative transposase YdaD [Verrucomicrobiales bacterium]
MSLCGAVADDLSNSHDSLSGGDSPSEVSDDYWIDLARHPHDAFFKEIFTNTEDATAFFQSHLPPDVVESCEWSTLKVLPGSFVKSTLQQAHSDLLFSVQSRSRNPSISGNSETREFLLYLLFEHQSNVDPIMPLRLLSYMVQIFSAHHERHGLPLPPVIGFVLHQGPDKWTVSQHFDQLFDLPDDPVMKQALLPFLPNFQHGLLDLTQCDPGQDEDVRSVRIVLQLMKLAREKRLLEFFDWLVMACQSFLEDLPSRRLETLLLYALHADSNLDIEQLARNVESSKQLQKLTMSVAEKLKAEGKAEGKIEGKTEGKIEGLWIGRIQLLQTLMGKEASTDEDLTAQSIEELQEMFEVLQVSYDATVKGK